MRDRACGRSSSTRAIGWRRRPTARAAWPWPRRYAPTSSVDIGLPSLDGYEVARHVRAARGAAPILVAITGYGQADDRRRSLEAGFDA